VSEISGVLKQCLKCGGPIELRWFDQEVATMADPPHQAAPYVRTYRWQCLRVEDHHGERVQQFDGPDMGAE
jgi:hypothetical protein